MTHTQKGASTTHKHICIIQKHTHTHTFVNHSTNRNRNRTKEKLIYQSLRCNRNCGLFESTFCWGLWKSQFWACFVFNKNHTVSKKSYALLRLTDIICYTQHIHTFTSYWLDAKRNEQKNEKCEENISCLIWNSLGYYELISNDFEYFLEISFKKILELLWDNSMKSDCERQFRYFMSKETL